MARQRTPKPQGKSRGGTLVGMFIGLVLGVVLAAAVVWFFSPGKDALPGPFSRSLTKQEGTPPATAGTSSKTVPEPLALSGKPGDPMPQKRFDFHDILTGKSEGLPASKAAEKKAEANEPARDSKSDNKPEGKAEPKSQDARTPVFFQAGSFVSAADADNQKAKLALLGVEANILQVMVQEKTFYRVRIGPYASAQEAGQVRSELARNGIDVTLIPKE